MCTTFRDSAPECANMHGHHEKSIQHTHVQIILDTTFMREACSMPCQSFRHKYTHTAHHQCIISLAARLRASPLQVRLSYPYTYSQVYRSLTVHIVKSHQLVNQHIDQVLVVDTPR